MSSGKGPLSRLYKTIDACHTWTLLFTNPDPEGFWDAIQFSTTSFGKRDQPEGVLIGDPVEGVFSVFVSKDSGNTWRRWGKPDRKGYCRELDANASKGEALFAASNQALLEFFDTNFVAVTGGPSGARLLYSSGYSEGQGGLRMGSCWTAFSYVDLPLNHTGASSGAFAVAPKDGNTYFPMKLMIVGGDYTKPDTSEGNSVFVSTREGTRLPYNLSIQVVAAQTPPHGYRSAVAYDAATKTWITVGPNGTDISTDDGRNFRPLKPDASDSPDADQHWNALSLPFVVGPHGRIGKLRPDALKPEPSGAKP